MSTILDRMNKILESSPAASATEEEEVSGDFAGNEKALIGKLAMVASSLYDMDDDDSMDKFFAALSQVVRKDKAKLKAALRRATPARAKATARDSLRALS
jgi:hypothetical protein